MDSSRDQLHRGPRPNERDYEFVDMHLADSNPQDSVLHSEDGHRTINTSLLSSQASVSEALIVHTPMAQAFPAPAEGGALGAESRSQGSDAEQRTISTEGSTVGRVLLDRELDGSARGGQIDKRRDEAAKLFVRAFSRRDPQHRAATGLARPSPAITRVWTKKYFRMIVAGESGLGKTTFINNMFRTYNKGEDVVAPGAVGDRTRLEDFVQDPHKLCSTFESDNPVTKEKIIYSIQDTPGYGDDMDVHRSIGHVTDFISEQNQRYFEQEMDLARDGEPEDIRFDICLYFIAAHRFRGIDVEFIQRLAKVVPVIPVIAKADSMTTAELDAFKEQIQVEAHNKQIEFFTFPEETWKEAEDFLGMTARGLRPPPFAVIASSVYEAVEKAGVGSWPVREYLWGTCQVFHPAHSDFYFLRTLVLELGFEQIKADTRRRHYEFRREYREMKRGRELATREQQEQDRLSELDRLRQKRSKQGWAWLRHLLLLVFTASLLSLGWCAAVWGAGIMEELRELRQQAQGQYRNDAALRMELIECRSSSSDMKSRYDILKHKLRSSQDTTDALESSLDSLRKRNEAYKARCWC